MSLYFFDTSALVKRYTPEKGTFWVRNITAPTAQNDIIIAQITPVELMSAIARQFHDDKIDLITLQSFRRLVMAHITNQYRVLALSSNTLLTMLFCSMNRIAYVLMTHCNLLLRLN